MFLHNKLPFTLCSSNKLLKSPTLIQSTISLECRDVDTSSISYSIIQQYHQLRFPKHTANDNGFVLVT